MQFALLAGNHFLFRYPTQPGSKRAGVGAEDKFPSKETKPATLDPLSCISKEPAGAANGRALTVIFFSLSLALSLPYAFFHQHLTVLFLQAQQTCTRCFPPRPPWSSRGTRL